MFKLFVPSICLTALFFAAGISAEEPRPGVQTESPSSRALAGSHRDQLDQVVEHLLKAAEHLEAAGLVEESAKIRHDARQWTVRDDVLSRKEAELECLQEEVDRLRALTGQIPSVAIETVVIEVDRGKLGLSARDFDKMVGFAQTSSKVVSASKNVHAAASQSFLEASSIVEANPFQLPLFRDLRDKGAIEVLAHPTVQSVTRRPASILVGGEIPIRVKSPTGEFSLRRIRIGTQIEVVATVLPSQRVRLQACVELAKITGDSVVDDDGMIQPQISSRRFNTEVEMQLGQTLAVGRYVIDRPAEAVAQDDKTSPQGTSKPIAHSYAPSKSVETVVFITPRLVQGAETPRMMPVVPAAAADQTEDANVPADFSPNDWDLFGPVVPVLKRRTGRP